MPLSLSPANVPKTVKTKLTKIHTNNSITQDKSMVQLMLTSFLVQYVLCQESHIKSTNIRIHTMADSHFGENGAFKLKLLF